MTDFEFAKLIETTDLTGGVVVYDKTKMVVVAKSILTHPNCINESKFLFLIDKKTEIRVGGVMNFGDDIQVYIKPAYRGQGYTSHVMREVVPYWMPALISVTSTYSYQDAKIEYLASLAQLTLRPRYISDSKKHQIWKEMDAHEEEVLANSAYARALAIAEQNPEELRNCPDKVTNPLRLHKNYGIRDAEFANDLERKMRIDCISGEIALPKVLFPFLDFKTASPEEIYLIMRRICAAKIKNDFEIYGVQITPYDDVPLFQDHTQWTMELNLNYVMLQNNSVCVSICSPYGQAMEWFESHVILDDDNQKSFKETSEVFYDWGSVHISKDYLHFNFHREFTENAISNLIQKYQIA